MNKIQRSIINNALDAAADLTEWEYNFISNIAEYDDDYILSEKQKHCLYKINNRLISEG